MALNLCAVVAVAENGVIGNNGKLPWKLPSDLILFRRLTMGKPIIMGRLTWESLKKKPLEGRHNIVVSRDQAYLARGASVVHSIDEAYDVAFSDRGSGEVIIIGGAQVYRSSIKELQRIYMTRVKARPEGDTFFPKLEKGAWVQVSSQELLCSPRDDHCASLVILERVPSKGKEDISVRGFTQDLRS